MVMIGSQSWSSGPVGRLGRGGLGPVPAAPDRQLKKTAKTASSTITRKIDWTTAVVVREPTCSLSPSTSIPWKQPASAMMKPNTGALIIAIHMSVIGITSCSRWM